MMNRYLDGWHYLFSFWVLFEETIDESLLAISIAILYLSILKSFILSEFFKTNPIVNALYLILNPTRPTIGIGSNLFISVNENTIFLFKGLNIKFGITEIILSSKSIMTVL